MRVPDFERAQASAAKLRPPKPAGVILKRASDVKLEPVHWLWPYLIPAGMFTVLGGAPGCGKTTIALAIAATISNGGDWPDGTGRAALGDVLIWSGEDGLSVLAARLKAMDADLSRVHFIEGVDNPLRREPDAFDPGRDMAMLEATAAKLPALRLLIVDPIVSAVAGDAHRGNEVRRALQPVVDLGLRLGCAVLGITHFSKGTSGREPVERITGSVAFGALARMVLVAAKAKPDGQDEATERRVLLRAKSNIGPDDGGIVYSLDRREVAPGVEGQRVTWGAPLQGSAREILADAEAVDDDEAEGARDAADWLRDLLTAGAMPVRDVKRHADEAGYAWRTVQRAMRRAGVDSRRGGFQQPAQWFIRATSAPVAPVAPLSEFGANGATEALNGATGADVEVFR